MIRHIAAWLGRCIPMKSWSISIRSHLVNTNDKLSSSIVFRVMYSELNQPMTAFSHLSANVRSLFEHFAV